MPLGTKWVFWKKVRFPRKIVENIIFFK